MVTIVDLSDRRDTRGLPEGYDPHKLYEYRYNELQKNASPLEKFIYFWIPFSLIRSFAIAIDPTSPFKVSPGVITPENRTKYRAVLSVLNTRKVNYSRVVRSYASLPNYNGIGGCTSPFTSDTGFSDNYSQGLLPQVPLPDKLLDTTSRTRLIGSKQGTLTLFKGTVNSPDRTVSQLSSTSSQFVGIIVPGDPCLAAGGTNIYKDGGTDNRYSSTSGGGAQLSEFRFKQLRDHEIAYNESLLSKHAVSLLKGWSPFNRDLTLFRSLAELKDIPSSVSSLRNTIRNFRQLYVSLSKSPSTRKIIFDLKKSAKDVPNEYLSYHFGWKQTWKDIQDLLAAPQKVTKRINFLIARSGQPTTFRSKRDFVSGESGVSGFEYETLRDEFLDTGDGVSSRIERESQLRLVINATFDFPPMMEVRFRNNLWVERLGVIPRPTDVYNLIPWTWLIDYFSGMGQYVELIDNLNRDPSLVNWGFLTCKSSGRLVSDHHSHSYSSVRRYQNNVQVESSDIKRANNHTSVYEFECQTRRDVSQVLDVNSTSDPTSLSAYQKSILGALLAQRTDFTRKKGLGRPRFF